MTLELLEYVDVDCPYCGESISCQIDTSIIQQNYIEDCQVCCAPIVFTVSIEDEEIFVSVATENE